MTKPIVYMDTSAWNALLDAALDCPLSLRSHATFLFSQCNLEEMALAPVQRAGQLAELAWEVSNRRKLWSYAQLAAIEIAHNGKRLPLELMFEDDDFFTKNWHLLRTETLPEEQRQSLRTHMEAQKRTFRNLFRQGRNAFSPFFDFARSKGFTDPWQAFLGQWEREGLLTEALWAVLESKEYLKLLPPHVDTHAVSYRHLPCTAVWLQYSAALAFLATHESGKCARPDWGDQIDYRHACYAGLVDTFVTADDRMFLILDEMVDVPRASILRPSAFLLTLDG